jgi:hypothetical protein
METNNNFYKHLGIEYSTTNNDILNAYEYKISAFHNKDILSDDDIQEIKMLKIALYILTHHQLRFKYNKLLNLKPDEKDDITLGEIISPNETLRKNTVFSKATFSEKSKDFLENETIHTTSKFLPQKATHFDETKQYLDLSSNDQYGSSFEIINKESSNDTMDSLFTIDNSWMNNINTINKQDAQSRKNKEEFNIISDRVFSLSEFNRPGLSSDFEEKLRQPHQGRVDKNSK